MFSIVQNARLNTACGPATSWGDKMGSSTAVREDRLWQRHMDMAKLGGTPKGGVKRTRTHGGIALTSN